MGVGTVDVMEMIWVLLQMFTTLID